MLEIYFILFFGISTILKKSFWESRYKPAANKKKGGGGQINVKAERASRGKTHISSLNGAPGGADIDRSLTGRCHRGGSFFNGP